MSLPALEGTEQSTNRVAGELSKEEKAKAAKQARRKREIEDEVLMLMNKTAKAWGIAELRLKAREAENDE